MYGIDILEKTLDESINSQQIRLQLKEKHDSQQIMYNLYKRLIIKFAPEHIKKNISGGNPPVHQELDALMLIKMENDKEVEKLKQSVDKMSDIITTCIMILKKTNISEIDKFIRDASIMRPDQIINNKIKLQDMVNLIINPVTQTHGQVHHQTQHPFKIFKQHDPKLDTIYSSIDTLKKEKNKIIEIQKQLLKGEKIDIDYILSLDVYKNLPQKPVIMRTPPTINVEKTGNINYI